MYFLYIIEFLFPGKLIIVFIIDKDLWFKILLEFQEQCLGKHSVQVSNFWTLLKDS